MRTALRVVSIVLALFLAVSAVAGGIGILTGFIPLGEELLQGSPFASYTLPGLALAILVGGAALFASILLFRRSRYALLVLTTAGVVIMFFEFVEVMAIGSPPGPARFLQIFYYAWGVGLVVVSMAAWLAELRSH